MAMVTLDEILQKTIILPSDVVAGKENVWSRNSIKIQITVPLILSGETETLTFLKEVWEDARQLNWLQGIEAFILLMLWSLVDLMQTIIVLYLRAWPD